MLPPYGFLIQTTAENKTNDKRHERKGELKRYSSPYVTPWRDWALGQYFPYMGVFKCCHQQVLAHRLCFLSTLPLFRLLSDVIEPVSNNPGIFTRLSCHLNWVAQEYDLVYPNQADFPVHQQVRHFQTFRPHEKLKTFSGVHPGWDLSNYAKQEFEKSHAAGPWKRLRSYQDIDSRVC